MSDTTWAWVRGLCIGLVGGVLYMIALDQWRGPTLSVSDCNAAMEMRRFLEEEAQ